MKWVCPLPPAPYGPTTTRFTPATTSPPALAPTTSLAPVKALELYIYDVSTLIFCTSTSNLLKDFMSERCFYGIISPCIYDYFQLQIILSRCKSIARTSAISSENSLNSKMKLPFIYNLVNLLIVLFTAITCSKTLI